ncbi:carbon storage regulator, partial [bacterium]|nr:carbon storage regulator [bacterium]NIO72971.1 carbon storage regulator [bacterium]
EIVIADVRGDNVRLGISAPKYVPVHRREVYETIHRKEALAK